MGFNSGFKGLINNNVKQIGGGARFGSWIPVASS